MSGSTIATAAVDSAGVPFHSIAAPAHRFVAERLPTTFPEPLRMSRWLHLATSRSNASGAAAARGGECNRVSRAGPARIAAA
jgi:hypothetical protein